MSDDLHAYRTLRRNVFLALRARTTVDDVATALNVQTNDVLMALVSVTHRPLLDDIAQLLEIPLQDKGSDDVGSDSES